MSLTNIGLRRVPNLYVDQAHIQDRGGTIPKIVASFIFSDVIINRKLYWSMNSGITTGCNVSITLEDMQGNVYYFREEPLNAFLKNPSSKIDENGNNVYIYKFEKTIDVTLGYYKDKSLILKTYIEHERTESRRTIKERSSVMRKVLQNPDGTVPERSFYFTLQNGDIYTGPYHYHKPTDTYMVGPRHTNVPHPSLNLNFVKNRSISYNALEKELSFTNTNKNTYSFKPKSILKNYTTKNNDRTISNLFMIDLYKLLLQNDQDSRKMYELNKELFSDVIQNMKVLDIEVTRVELKNQFYDNKLYTPVLRSQEKFFDQLLGKFADISEKKYENTDMDLEIFFDDNVMYCLLTDKQIKKAQSGTYKHVLEMNLKSTVSTFIDKNLKRMYKIISYYESFLNSLEIAENYDSSMQKLSDSYIKLIFSNFTNFETDADNNIIMSSRPEFHKHITHVADTMRLLKPISVEERQRIYDVLDGLINPITTNKYKLNNLLKILRDLVTQIRHIYGKNKVRKNLSPLRNKNKIRVDFRETQKFTYTPLKSFSCFRKLTRPVLSIPEIKSRFDLERSRYFGDELGETTFRTLPLDSKRAFQSTRSDLYTYLSPLTLEIEDRTIDLEDFDIFDDVANSIFSNPSVFVGPKINSSVSLLDKNSSYLDSAKIVGEASDFIINKSYPKMNLRKEIDPIVLTYTVDLNSIVELQETKFNLETQENLLLSYTKTLEKKDRLESLRSMPLQTKSLFYPGNLRNPLIRIREAKNFKVKKLIKNVVFTNYRVEYLSGFRETDGFINVHLPSWRKMINPDNINLNSKYIVTRLVANDRFGFRKIREFRDSNSFVLIKNKDNRLGTVKYVPPEFDRKYNNIDFTLDAYKTLNLLNNDMELTMKIDTERDLDLDMDMYQFFGSRRNSSKINVRSRKYLKKTGMKFPPRRGERPPTDQLADSPTVSSPTIQVASRNTGGGSVGGGY